MTSLWHVLWAAPAAAGFAMFFNVRKRALLIVMVIAVVARFASDFGKDQGLTIVAADFIAAFIVGGMAYTLGPRTGEASPVYSFAPVIPLIPGAVITEALTSLITWITTDSGSGKEQDFINAASSGFTAAAIILALCLGTISPMLLLPRTRTAED